jgi:hypothetical protein
LVSFTPGVSTRVGLEKREILTLPGTELQPSGLSQYRLSYLGSFGYQ